MNGIILKTEQECIDLIKRIDTNVNFLFKGITQTYTHHIAHPTNGNFAVIINFDDFMMLMTQFPDLIEQIGSEYVEKIEGLDRDEWMPPLPEDL